MASQRLLSTSSPMRLPSRRHKVPPQPHAGGTAMGYRHTAESRAKISAAMRGNANLSAAMRGNRNGVGNRGHRTHGLSRHELYGTWKMMLERCENPANPHYPDYGGRGIRVCDRWHEFATYISDIEGWLGPRPKDRTPSGYPIWSLDRIQNDHDYRLDNVRWATRSDQRGNRRDSRARALHAGRISPAEVGLSARSAGLYLCSNTSG